MILFFKNLISTRGVVFSISLNALLLLLSNIYRLEQRQDLIRNIRNQTYISIVPILVPRFARAFRYPKSQGEDRDSKESDGNDHDSSRSKRLCTLRAAWPWPVCAWRWLRPYYRVQCQTRASFGDSCPRGSDFFRLRNHDWKPDSALGTPNALQPCSRLFFHTPLVPDNCNDYE